MARNGKKENAEMEMARKLPGGRDVTSSLETAGGTPPEKPISLTRLIFACMVAGGIQYGWALQLSLLTPFVQTLGVSHTLSSFMWLCGPIAGFVVQPIVGYYSDRCNSRFGRRRPFIFAGCLIICVCVVIIGFSSDIGFALGDTKENCSVFHGARWKAVVFYVLGFWMLDFANNTVQGPLRALMADLSGPHGMNAANAIFCSWMGLGNILGYSSGSTNDWHKWFPFLLTEACCESCANLKGAFLVAVIFLLTCLVVTLYFAKEVPLYELSQSNGGAVPDDEQGIGIFGIFKSFKNLPPGMPSVLLVTALTWFTWFPYNLYNTDWMGREIYHGEASGTTAEIDAYDKGVREGAFGLLLNSVVLAITSFVIEPLCRKVTARRVWMGGISCIFVGMAAMAIVGKWSASMYHGAVDGVITADKQVKAIALAIFTFLGIPQAMLFSIPFAYTSQLVQNEGGGQGLCIGVLNISIVVPQVIVSLGAGPWDALFGKGNAPAFALASAVSLVTGAVAYFMLPKISKSSFNSSGVGGFH